MKDTITRRSWLKGSAVSMSGIAAACTLPSSEKKEDTFVYCLNTSTIRGQKLGLIKEIELAARAGFQAIEPWVRDIQGYLEQGGDLAELRKRIHDSGLSVESAIAFSRWISEDETERQKGLEEARRDMDLLAQIGGKRIACPPSGATDTAGLNLFKAAERYRELLELGDKMGVVPQLEVWGFSKNLSRLGEAVFVAVESGHRDACLLPDVYHIYKGGSDYEGLRLLSEHAIHAFHMNDFPADPPRETIGDGDRVFPGDGIAPLQQIIQDIYHINPEMVLSLELFSSVYWQQDAFEVAQTGLKKLKKAVAQAFV